MPAAIWLLFIVIYPTIDTIRLSLFNESATKFLGLTNYKTVFSTDTILTAFRNNVIWVLIFPFLRHLSWPHLCRARGTNSLGHGLQSVDCDADRL